MGFNGIDRKMADTKSAYHLFIHLSSKYFFIDLRINSALEIILSPLNFSSNCSIKFLSKSTDIHL